MGNRPKRRTPRAVRTDVWKRPVADPSSALAELDKARGYLTLVSIGKDPADVPAQVVEAHAEAQKAYDACFEEIVFHGLRAPQFEALMAEHPPTDADLKDGLAHCDATFLPALLEACCQNGWTAEDWVEELDEMTVGERTELKQLVTYLNTRTWSAQIPKG